MSQADSRTDTIPEEAPEPGQNADHNSASTSSAPDQDSESPDAKPGKPDLDEAEPADTFFSEPGNENVGGIPATASDPDLEFAVVDGNPVPADARLGRFTTEDGKNLRFATFRRQSGTRKGTICLLQGRAEFIEKYFETIIDFQKRGFAVATFDWRGQGGSDRLARNRVGHVRSFDDYWVDLKSFYADILVPGCPPPYYLVGHSTGGLVALDAGTRDRTMFERMFLSSPLLGVHGHGTAKGQVLGLVLKALGLSRMPIGRKSDKPVSESAFPGNDLTTDFRRYMRQVALVRARPDLETLVPTVGWAAAAFNAIAKTEAPDFPSRLAVPVVMLAAARDTIADSTATELLGVRLRNGRHSILPGARHELFMEADGIRSQVLAAFDAFIGDPSKR